MNNAYRLEPKKESKRPGRKGLWKCGGCREQSTVTVGTIFEDSHIPLNKWLLAYHLLCASKKGMSAHQLHRMLKINYRSAWFMVHRIRYTMSQEPLSSKLSGVIEVDETYIGGKKREKQSYAVKPGQRPQDIRNPFANKQSVVSVLQRGGRVQSKYVQRVTAENLKPIAQQMIAEDCHVMTDSSSTLKGALMTRKHDQVRVSNCQRELKQMDKDDNKSESKITNSKPIPHLPLPFKEVIADVLKVKPPQKVKRVAKARKPKS